jgi:hypothetical protein
MSSPIPIQTSITSSLELSFLADYGGDPTAIEGVGFWARVSAHVINLVVHCSVGLWATFLFGMGMALAASFARYPLPRLMHRLRVRSPIPSRVRTFTAAH